MEVKTVSYKRVNNLGNYSNEHMEMFAELSAEDDINQCALDLKNHVETVLGLNKPKEKVKTKNHDEKPY